MLTVNRSGVRSDERSEVTGEGDGIGKRGLGMADRGRSYRAGQGGVQGHAGPMEELDL
jgi:hypothetical protein